MLQLSDQQKIDLAKAGRDLHDLLPDYDHLEKCGKDCQLLRQQNLDTQAKIQYLQQHLAGLQHANRELPGSG